MFFLCGNMKHLFKKKVFYVVEFRLKKIMYFYNLEKVWCSDDLRADLQMLM